MIMFYSLLYYERVNCFILYHDNTHSYPFVTFLITLLYINNTVNKVLLVVYQCFLSILTSYSLHSTIKESVSVNSNVTNILIWWTSWNSRFQLNCLETAGQYHMTSDQPESWFYDDLFRIYYFLENLLSPNWSIARPTSTDWPWTNINKLRMAVNRRTVSYQLATN